MPVVGRNEPERDYLSIREVLEHLVEEFPDVTISKIRFLESRGLIHPERTPSGYRKFFPADLERLRWILVQQRENFLPLKVIKGRLDREGGAAPVFPAEASLFEDEYVATGGSLAAETPAGGEGGSQEARAATPPRPGVPATPPAVVSSAPGDVRGSGTAPRQGAAEAHSGAGRTGTEPAGMPAAPAFVGAGASPVSTTAAPAGTLAARGGTTPSVATTASPTSSTLRAGTTLASDRPSGASGSPERPEVAAIGADPSTQDAPLTSRDLVGREPPHVGGPQREAPQGASSQGAPSSPHTADQTRPSASEAVADQGGGLGDSVRSGGDALGGDAGAEGTAHVARPNRRRAGEAGLSGASFSPDELAGAAGATVELVDALAEYRLIHGKMVAGVLCYDEQALPVVKVAASFLAFGIEPRHLKAVKHSVERQIALYAQVVTPLLRQRNPQARGRAVQDLETMAELGRSLEDLFVAEALREITGG